MGLPIIIFPTATHIATLIFLHGLGDTGHGWFSEMKELSRHLPFFKFILPNAPIGKVTLNGGMKMPCWYDIYGLHENAREDEQGVKDSCGKIESIIEEEIKSGIKSEKVFIGGFSQGGAISLYTGINLKEKIGGIIALSAYIPLRGKIEEPKRRDIPYLLCHGTFDPVIPYEWGKMSAEWLSKKGLNVTWKSYKGMQHESCSEEFRDILEFLQNQTEISKRDL